MAAHLQRLKLKTIILIVSIPLFAVISLIFIFCVQPRAFTDIAQPLTFVFENGINARHNITTSVALLSENENMHGQTVLETDADGYQWPPNMIYTHPLRNEQCKNAIFEIDQLDMDALPSEHSICNTDTKFKPPSIWTRESLASVKDGTCYPPPAMFRTEQKYTAMVRNNRSRHHKQRHSDLPIYYHIPKCASSSVAKMLAKEPWNFDMSLAPNPHHRHIIAYTHCGFTFIRHPMQRFISAYYTVNKYLWLNYAKDTDGHPSFLNNSYAKHEEYRFIHVMGEPQRFETYVEEMIADPVKFGYVHPFRHSATQTLFLSEWHDSDLQFVGRVELFDQHWKELMQQQSCQWFVQQNASTSWDEQDILHVSYSNFSKPIWQTADEHEFTDALNFSVVLNSKVDAERLLPPMYYLMTKQMHDKLVKFYWQDYVCFGYPTSWENFQKYVAKYVNPFTTK